LKLNPHLQAVVLGGVYVPAADGAPECCPLPCLSTTAERRIEIVDQYWADKAGHSTRRVARTYTTAV
jgi:hypothetical protein